MNVIINEQGAFTCQTIPQLKKKINLEDLDFDELECQLDEDFGDDLDRELAERLAELDFIDEQNAQIANPDMLSQIVLNTV